MEDLRQRCAALEDEPPRKSVDREKLLQHPAYPEVLFDNGLGQAPAIPVSANTSARSFAGIRAIPFKPPPPRSFSPLRRSSPPEKARQQKAKAKLEVREFATAGEALCKYAAQSAEFHLMISQVLQTAVTDEPTRKFLSGRGWL
ncbi:MAG: hypothetical protein ACLQOO_04850 [Terriglobia bacterium]